MVMPKRIGINFYMTVFLLKMCISLLNKAQPRKCTAWIGFSENRTVYEIMSKNLVETEGPQMTSQYGAYAFRAGSARLHARMRKHTPTRPGTHMHERTRKHAHTDQYVILIAFPQQQWFRECALLLRYTYIGCLA
jgi:hypothetical protein